MYCRKCGNKSSDNARFFNKCGASLAVSSNDSILSPVKEHSFQNKNSTEKKPEKKPKKKIIIVCSIVAAILTVAIFTAILITANSSLESKLTRSVWYCEKQDQYLEFYKNGTYQRTYSSGKTKTGNWSINGNELKLGSQRYKWRNDLNDRSIENHNVGNEYYSWYVSDGYFVYCNDCIYGADKSEVYQRTSNSDSVDMNDPDAINEAVDKALRNAQ